MAQKFDEQPPTDDEIAVVRGVAPFAMLPEWLILHPDVTDKALRLYALLYRYADSDTKVAYPSRRRLARQMRCSLDTVDRALTKLVAVGAVTVTRRTGPKGDNTSSLYRLEHNPPEGHVPPSLKDVPEAPPKDESKVRKGKGGGRTGAATPSRTGAATPSRTGAALTRTSSNESHLEGGSFTLRNAGAGARARTSTPTPRRFPTQCERHQDGPNEIPCRHCRDARETHDAAVAAAAAAPEVLCDRHDIKHKPGVECIGCAADRKARRAS